MLARNSAIGIGTKIDKNESVTHNQGRTSSRKMIKKMLTFR